jgi:hypothetical protein
MYDLIYKKKNRYVIQIESPVIILPIHQTFQGRNAPVWVIRTGDVMIVSEDL